MADAFFLSEDDRQILMEIIHQAKQQKKNTTGRPVIPRDDHQAPEVYLGKVAAGGITAADGDELGIGDVEIYRVLEDTLEKVFSAPRTVRSISSSEMDEDTQCLIVRDKFGQWLSIEGGSGAGGGQVISWKHVVRCASTGNINVASPGSTIDTVLLVESDTLPNRRVLLKNQSTPSQNGIYDWHGAAVPMTRSADADDVDELVGACVVVSEGALDPTGNRDTIWLCITNRTITPGTTGTAWVKVYPTDITDTTTVLAEVTVSANNNHTCKQKNSNSGGGIIDLIPSVTFTQCRSTTGGALPVGCLVSLDPVRTATGNHWITPVAYASLSMPGLVSITAQVFKGNKTFDDFIHINDSNAKGLYLQAEDGYGESIYAWSDTAYVNNSDRIYRVFGGDTAKMGRMDINGILRVGATATLAADVPNGYMYRDADEDEYLYLRPLSGVGRYQMCLPPGEDSGDMVRYNAASRLWVVIPSPAANGNYVLRLTMSGGSASYTWVNYP